MLDIPGGGYFAYFKRSSPNAFQLRIYSTRASFLPMMNGTMS